jgi:Zinc finger, C2H2 type
LICHSCINELDQAYQFKEKSSNSESVLRSILGGPALTKVDVKIEVDLLPTNVQTTETPTDLPLLSEYMIKIEEGCELEVAALEVLKEKPSKTTVQQMDKMLNVKFPCILCNQEFATKKYLNRHITRHLAGRLKASRKERLLEKHYNIPVLEKHPCKTPTEAVPFKFHHRIGCPFCGMMFANQGVYDKHYKTYHLYAKIEKSEEPSTTPVLVNDLMSGVFICHYDGRKFGIKKQLRRHMNRYHRPAKRLKKKFKCRRLNCEETFVTFEKLEQHRREHDEKLAQLVYTCDICSKSLKTLHSLKLHMDYVHNPTKDFLCNECGKGFVTKCKQILQV